MLCLRKQDLSLSIRRKLPGPLAELFGSFGKAFFKGKNLLDPASSLRGSSFQS